MPVWLIGKMIKYKVIELSTVTDEVMEKTLNEWTSKGWSYDGVQFAMRDSSKRPSMAFVFFTREITTDEAEESERPSLSSLHPTPPPAPVPVPVTPVSGPPSLLTAAAQKEPEDKSDEQS